MTCKFVTAKTAQRMLRYEETMRENYFVKISYR